MGGADEDAPLTGGSLCSGSGGRRLMPPRSDEHRRRLSEARQRSYRPPCSRDDLQRLYRDEGLTRREIAAKLGVSEKAIQTAMRHFGIPARRAIKRDQRGPRNHAWKGGDAGYQAKHLRVATLRGTPQHCDECGTTSPDKTYDWANLTGNYDHPDDYVRVCRQCHRKIDIDSYQRDPATGRFVKREVVT